MRRQERRLVDQGAVFYTIKPVYLFWAECCPELVKHINATVMISNMSYTRKDLERTRIEN